LNKIKVKCDYKKIEKCFFTFLNNIDIYRTWINEIENIKEKNIIKDDFTFKDGIIRNSSFQDIDIYEIIKNFITDIYSLCGESLDLISIIIDKGK
jgi:hypothetical protein